MYEYPVIITKQPDGSYTWSCSIEVDYFRRNMGLGFKACIGNAVFMLLYGAWLSFPHKDWTTMLIVAGCVGVFLLITFLVFGLTLLASDPQEGYMMTDTYVKSGSGKSSVYFDYSKARTAVFTRKYIELQGRVKKIRVYFPEEDRDFVKSFIMSRLPWDCQKRYI